MTYLDDLREAGRRKLEWQSHRARGYLDYYAGDGEGGAGPMLESAERQAFRKLLRESGANWSRLIVNATAERLQVDGFRFGAASEAAWAIWQANSMDADGELVQREALAAAVSCVLVQPDPDNPSGVAITGESPLEACVLYEPGSRRRRAAGYKRFTGLDGRTTEVVITADTIATWGPAGDLPSGEPDTAVNPARLVGMIEVVPQPQLSGWPSSELDPAISFVDRIETTIWNRLVATDYSAFRQVWGTGVKIPREQGEPGPDGEVVRYRPPFNVGADRLLLNENPAGRFGSFPESTLSGYLAAVEQDVTHMAAITQTPPHYLLGTLVNLSADAIKAAEAGLVSKVRLRSLHIGEAWEEVMRTALGLIGNPAAAEVGAEVVWRDFETRSIAQLADALLKLKDIGVPTEVLWEKWGATQTEIARWRQMLADQQAREAAGQAASLGLPDVATLLGNGGGG